MVVLFDTRAYHRTLTDAGLPPEQADAHPQALAAALDGGIATKQGIAEVRGDIASVRQDVHCCEKTSDEISKSGCAA